MKMKCVKDITTTATSTNTGQYLWMKMITLFVTLILNVADTILISNLGLAITAFLQDV